jgi:hypothetical protein
MRLAMRLLLILALPGLLFGFLLRAQTNDFRAPFGVDFWQDEPSWLEVLMLVAVAAPAVILGAAVLIVARWIRSGPRPDRRAS